jgi:hypothetical protein
LLTYVKDYAILVLSKASGERLDLLHTQDTGGDNMTVSDVINLLTLLAVVIFGVINVTQKK